MARGVDERPVRADRERKSVRAEDTFVSDLFDLEGARKELAPLVGKVWRYCEERSIQGRTVTLKVKFADFQQITRSRTVVAPSGAKAELTAVAGMLLWVTLSNLSVTLAEPNRQMSLTI
ncbi:hypothetical protein [Mesorhizobium sp.]|uniref:DinB/UmuC family translesion DNA polymerase n=1 Tax=Mesorhizobium sp. TaxID=1871066 RepID=UPI000FE454D4|nr:hypothetical protein [Mesorhizobium sp.]RWP97834.1 MAG: hypothetical protein EOR89_20495 [Mesorhizobium sp.]RWQ52808.1 MAG: hypothetical protein EOS82_10525 [Mesorhizobium sp.]